MSEFMYVNPAMKNQKTGENVREAESAKLDALKKAGKVIVGLEMTVPALAELCDKNIDPQHTDGNSAQSCVKEVTENAAKLLKECKGKDVVFVTNRVDLDSVVAYIAADRYLQGKPQSYNENVAAINKHDTFSAGKWEGPKPIQAFNPENKTGALASSIKVFMVTPDNIKTVADFMDTGKVDETIMANYQKVQKGIIDRVNSGEIKVEVKGGIAHVTTTLPCATNVGYAFAPVVIAENPAMKLGPAGTPFRKVSVCQHEAGYVNLDAVKASLTEKEAGWGGSPTFIGSKQGENCNVPFEEIQKNVYANLTPDYKAKVTARSKGLTANGKDISR